MNRIPKTVYISEAIAPNLMLRGVADIFFDQLEKVNPESYVIDFKGVESISRSFAHQYCVRKSRSTKKFVEINMPENVVKMMNLVVSAMQNEPSRPVMYTMQEAIVV